MLINITDPVAQTVFFSAILFLLLVSSVKKSQNGAFLTKEVTEQLKGFAILAIVFSHVGYFLSSDNRFLYPLSVLAGTGVNLFLFLSGFGLTVSHIKFPLPVLSFYRKRLLKLFIPMWAAVILFLLMDYFVLSRTYPASEIIHNFLGFFPRADLFQNLDSPLWYFSVILFYYLIFPLGFIGVLLISLIVIYLPLPVHPDVLNLYKLHTLAFPMGMLLGLAIQKLEFKPSSGLKFLIFAAAVLVFLYTSINSGVGGGLRREQGISLVTTLSILIIFSFSGLKFKLLSLFGVYSYEIYLLHWPILSRYNLFLGLPPFLSVLLNTALIFLLGKIVNRYRSAIWH